MRSLYVHIPFCLKKCPYCAFYSETGCPEKMGPYVKKVKEEAERYEKQEVRSIYFGGGTPSALPEEYLAELLGFLLKRFPCSREITLEVNPATVSLPKLLLLRKAGFNRISIGVQSLRNNELTFLGRLHTSADAIRAVSEASSAGFKNISCDVIFGLPEQSIEDLNETLTILLKLPISHISTYSLSIEEGTTFSRLNLSLPDESLERSMFYYIRDFLLQNNFTHYEISNFSKKGMESIHNLHYWKCGEYIGLGAGAHGFYQNIRYENITGIDAYLRSENVIASKYELTSTDKKEEYYMLGLRMRNGIPDDGNPKIPNLIRVGLLEKKNGNIRLTDRGLDIANYVICELFT